MLKTLLCLLLLITPIAFTFGNAAIDITITCLAITFLIKTFKEKEFLYYKTIWFIIFIVFWLYLIITSFVSPNIATSIKASLTFIRFPIFGLAIAYIIANYPHIRAPLFFTISTILIMLFLSSLMQILIGHDFFGNKIVTHANFFRLVSFSGKQRIGYIAAFLLLPLLGYFVDRTISRSNTKLATLFISIAILCGFITILLSGERMAIIIAIVSTFLSILLISQIRLKALIIFGLIFFTATAITFSVPQLKHRIIEESLHQISQPMKDQYGKIYQFSWNLFIDNPIVGIGSNQFKSQCYKIKETSDNPKLRCANHPHNWYLQVLAENGMIGISLFIIMNIVIALTILEKKYEYYSYFAGILVITKLLPIIPSSNLYNSYSSAPLWYAIGIALSSLYVKHCPKKINILPIMDKN